MHRSNLTRSVLRFASATIASVMMISSASSAQATATTSDNPLLQPSPLPFGFPQFDLIKSEHFEPALELGMAEERSEISAIVGNPEAANFTNTIVALEQSGQLLDRVQRIFSALNGTDTNPTLKALDSKMAPAFSALRDEIYLNDALFKRVSTVHSQLEELNLNTEARRLVEQTYTQFVRAGARLNAAQKTRLTALNTEAATLSITFKQNVLEEVNTSSVLIDTAEELAGLSPAAIKSAGAAATKAGHDGKFLIVLQNTSNQPILASLENRATRAKIHAASLVRGSRGGDYDNRMVVARIAKNRAERAQLLGYQTYADYVLEERTARTTDAVNAMLGKLAPAAAANVTAEANALQQAINAESALFTLTPSDWSYYTGKVRQARFAYDENELRPYLELDRVINDGVFYAAHLLYGISFKPRPDLPVYNPDVRVWEVLDTDGQTLAFFVGDYYARSSKRGGAWMSAYVSQSNLLGTHPVVSNNLNIEKPAAGEPTLLTWSETKTLFHEFGHALHGMFSQVTYPRFSGTSVPRDFVEFPSQVNEMWRTWPEILAHYAKHYQTGEPIPADLLAKIDAASKFNQGFMTAEYLAASLLDQAWHQLTPDQVPATSEAVMAFEQAALERVGLDLPAVPPRYRTTYFSHAFSGGYAAGYYSYIWSEVLDADTVEWFKSHGGLTRANGDRFRQTLLSRGESDDPMLMFRNFTGHEPTIEPLLNRRGLNPASAAK